MLGLSPRKAGGESVGFFDRFRRGKPVSEDAVAVGAKKQMQDPFTGTFDNGNITFTGNLESYDYSRILRDKQANITSLYELSDYYIDSDPIFRGLIKGVYTPFSVSDFHLVGGSENAKKNYQEYYERIQLRDKMWDIFYQLYKYGNVFIYMMEKGNLIT